MRNKEVKQYVVRKFIIASNLSDAIKLEKEHDVDEIYINENYKEDKIIKWFK